MERGGHMDYQRAETAFYDTLFAQKPALRRLFPAVHDRTAMFTLGLQAIHDYTNDTRHTDYYLAWLGQRHQRLPLTQDDVEAGLLAFRQAIKAGGIRLDTPEADHYMLAYDKIIENMGLKPTANEKSRP